METQIQDSITESELSDACSISDSVNVQVQSDDKPLDEVLSIYVQVDDDGERVMCKVKRKQTVQTVLKRACKHFALDNTT